MHPADPTVGLEVGSCEFVGMQLQEQIGTADIGGRIAPTSIRPIDHDWLRGVAQDVQRMEVAVTQLVALRHLRQADKQAMLPRGIEYDCVSNVSGEPQLEAAKLDR